MNKTYPLALVNITNRCNLKCKHCFVFREGNPNTPTKENEMSANTMIKELKKYKKKYGILRMLWMGGEPLLRQDVLELGVKVFPLNVIATNGTLPIPNIDPKIHWTVSIDGPEQINDEIRGKGSFQKVLNTLNNLPDNFPNKLQCQCAITKKNEDFIEELAEILMKETSVHNLVLSFYVPKKNDTSEFAWNTLEERDSAVKKAIALKNKYPSFIPNRELALEFMLSQNALQYTRDCCVKNFMLPLYLGNEGFEIPFCCYGNDVNCDLCGSFGVFHIPALKKENPQFETLFI
ncbi:MAG: radical SAM protein [Promethearchaeota archaeon]